MCGLDCNNSTHTVKMGKRLRQEDHASDEEGHTTQLPVEIIELILSFLCVRGEEEDGENHCVMIAKEISRLRRVNRLFSQLVDSSLTLWRKVLSFTRRATIQPPPLMPNGVPGIKAFVLLDNREFNLRMRLAVYGESYDHGHLISERSQSTLDYREVNLGGYRDPAHIPKNQVLWYDYDLDKYREIVKKMNDLCGCNK